MATLTTSFLSDYPEHEAIIGKFLTSYAELEADMLFLIMVALKTEGNHAIRILYSLRSEADRLKITDSLCRAEYSSLGLKSEFGRWIGAMRFCKKIRNQFAHCTWRPHKGGLVFCDLEGAAKAESESLVAYRPIDLDLLKLQEQFFAYTEDVTWYLIREGRFQRDKRRKHKLKMPKALQLPNLYNPQS